MPQYRNIPERFATLRKRIILKSIPLLLIGVIAGLSISYFSEKNDASDLSTWLLVIIVVIVIMAYAIFKSIKRQKEIYNSYLLTIGTDQLSRQQNGLPAVTLFFSEITQITEDKDENLIVKGEKVEQYVTVSAFVENYGEVKNFLQTLKPITQHDTKKLFQKYPFIIPLIAIGLMAAVYLSNNKVIVAISGILIIALLVWAFYKIRTSTQVDSRIKRSALWVLLLIITIILIVYNKVFGQ